MKHLRQKLKLLSLRRSNHQIDDNDCGRVPGPDDLDIQAPYKNLRLKEAAESYKDLDISDHAKVRLLIARTLAVERHKQKWG